MKQTFIFLFFLLTLLGSCSNHRMEMSRLAYIDSLMEVNAQIAYDSSSQDSGVFLATGDRSLEMKYRLLMAKAQNKLFLKMPSDSLFQEVVDYYDSKGTPNEKMEAQYLLGCIYRDQGESPKAMQCYQRAIDCVDSLNKESHEITLARVYGQMIHIYKKQYYIMRRYRLARNIVNILSLLEINMLMCKGNCIWLQNILKKVILCGRLI